MQVKCEKTNYLYGRPIMEREIFNELTKQKEVYSLVRELNRVNNGIFYLYAKENNKVVIKELINKIDDEGQFEIDKELYSYERLESLGIYIPKMIGYNREENIVIKEYLEGKDLLGLIRDEKLSMDKFLELLKYSELLNSDNLNIDYFPNNFIMKDEKLFYINYKVFPYTEELNLRNWGIYYWINSLGIRQYMETGDEKSINVEGKKIPVITNELNKKRDEIYLKYLEWKYEKDN